MMKMIGMDQLLIIRTEVEDSGTHLSAEAPRSTTWKEDKCLLDIIFRLGDKYGMTVFWAVPSEFQICSSKCVKRCSGTSNTVTIPAESSSCFARI